MNTREAASMPMMNWSQVNTSFFFDNSCKVMKLKSQEQRLSVGQGLWMDDYSRELILDGSLFRYIDEFSVTGLSLNSLSLQNAIAEGSAYDDVVRKKLDDGLYGERLACSLALDDIRHAADLLRSVYDMTDGVDGWAILPASPLAADKPETLTKTIIDLHEKISRPNVLVEVPAAVERIKNIEELVYAGVPLENTNIHSKDQYLEVADACLAGIERRVEKKLKPVVPVFISICIARHAASFCRFLDRQSAVEAAVTFVSEIYDATRNLRNSARWGRAYNAGARPMKTVWNCSWGSVDRDLMLALAGGLIAPFTVIHLPKDLIPTFQEIVGKELMENDAGKIHLAAQRLSQAGCDLESLGTELQKETVVFLKKSWISMLETMAVKSAEVSQSKKRQFKEKQDETSR